MNIAHGVAILVVFKARIGNVVIVQPFVRYVVQLSNSSLIHDYTQDIKISHF
mgnify:FL=1